MTRYDWRTGAALPAQPKKTGLSAREIEILQALAQGMTRNQAALELGISANTLGTHLLRAYQFLGAVSAAEAVQKFQETQAAAPAKAEPAKNPAETASPRREEGLIRVKVDVAVKVEFEGMCSVAAN